MQPSKTPNQGPASAAETPIIRVGKLRSAAGKDVDLGAVDPATVGELIAKLPMYYINTAKEVFEELDVPGEFMPGLLAKAAIRRGKGGRQKEEDPRLDPKFKTNPARAARILANREAAARSKLKQKLMKEAQAIKKRLMVDTGATEQHQISSGNQPPSPPAAAAVHYGGSGGGAGALHCLAAVAGLFDEAELQIEETQQQQQPQGLDDLADSDIEDDDCKHAVLQWQQSSSQYTSTTAAETVSPTPDPAAPQPAAEQQLQLELDAMQQQLSSWQSDLESSQQHQQQSADTSNTSDSNKRKRSTSADSQEALAALASEAAAAGDQPHRSKRKRHLTTKAVEAAVAGLLPSAAMIPPEVLAEHEEAVIAAAAPAVAAVSPNAWKHQHEHQQQWGCSPEPLMSSSQLAQCVFREVHLLNSSNPSKMLDAMVQLLVLLRQGLYSAGDKDTDGAMQVALSGLIQVLEKHHCVSIDLLPMLLEVLQVMARTHRSYQQFIVQCKTPAKLVRLLEDTNSILVREKAVMLLDSLVVNGQPSTVDAVANAGGVEVLLLLLAASKQGSELRTAAAKVLCSMATVQPNNDEVATAAAGVTRVQQSWLQQQQYWHTVHHAR